MYRNEKRSGIKVCKFVVYSLGVAAGQWGCQLRAWFLGPLGELAGHFFQATWLFYYDWFILCCP